MQYIKLRSRIRELEDEARRANRTIRNADNPDTAHEIAKAFLKEVSELTDKITDETRELAKTLEPRRGGPPSVIKRLKDKQIDLTDI